MQLDIQTHGFLMTDGIRGYTERRLKMVIGRHDQRISKVSVWLADINGPRGGEDKRCRIELKVSGDNPIVIEDTESNLYVAIDRASERCARTLNRYLERVRENKYQTISLNLPE